MTDNPLWFLFIMTTIVSAYLSMSISTDYEAEKVDPKKGLVISIAVVITLAVVFGGVTSLPETTEITDGLIVGLVVLISGLVPVLYIYSLRKKRNGE